MPAFGSPGAFQVDCLESWCCRPDKINFGEVRMGTGISTRRRSSGTLIGRFALCGGWCRLEAVAVPHGSCLPADVN